MAAGTRQGKGRGQAGTSSLLIYKGRQKTCNIKGITANFKTNDTLGIS